MLAPSCRFAAAVALAIAAAAPAKAIIITPSGDAFGLANTLFLNLPGLTVNNARLTAAFLEAQPGDGFPEECPPDTECEVPSVAAFSTLSTVTPTVFQSGVYTNAAGTYGLPNSGIALSSGNVADYAAGPNLESGRTTSFGVPSTLEQDDLLSPITGQNDHKDVVQLDIEFFAATAASTITFFATFGSEEWDEFVDSPFIDGFGLYVNGTNVAGALQTGGVAGDPVLPININHPDMRDIAGTELDGILAPNGNPVLRFDVPITPGAQNAFTVILADASDSSLDTTIYLSSFFSEGIVDGGPTGATEFDPILPNNPPDPVTGAFTIEIEDTPAETTVWIDPPVSVGFEYEAEGGSEFASFTAPSLASVADLDGYLITVGGVSEALAAGATLDFFDVFGVTPTAFTLTQIDPALGLDPTNPLAFPSGVSFTTAGAHTVIMTPITFDTDNPVTPVPLPASAMLYAAGLGLAGFAARRKAKAAA